ncbi:MAG: PKD domain-containing protein [Candidatus Woesearchaeota archaeon]
MPLASGKETALIASSNETVALNAATLFGNSALVDAFWDFADDTYGEGISVSHSYALEGVYMVAVNATDNANWYYGNISVIVGGSVPFVSEQAPYVAMYFSEIPSGLFSLAVEQSDTSNLSIDGLIIAGKFFDITTSMPSFKATLVFSYDDADDDGTVDGTGANENLVDAYYYDSSWQKVPGAVLNTNADTITAEVSHFTLFAILASQPSAPQPEETPTKTGSNGGGGGGGGGAPQKPANATKTNVTANKTIIKSNITQNITGSTEPQETANKSVEEAAPLTVDEKPAKRGNILLIILEAIAAFAAITLIIRTIRIRRRKSSQKQAL